MRSFRNSEAIVITIVKNEGKYAFIIKKDGFLFSLNLAFTFDPHRSSEEVKCPMLNWFNATFPTISKEKQKRSFQIHFLKIWNQIRDTCVDELHWVENGEVFQFIRDLYINTAILDIKWIRPKLEVAFEGDCIPR